MPNTEQEASMERERTVRKSGCNTTDDALCASQVEHVSKGVDDSPADIRHA